MAPLVPFITDHVWDVIRPVGGPESVHLADWPKVREDLLDEELTAQMALVRRLVELGRAARASSGVRTRQPLGRALVGAPGWATLPGALRAQITEELNVQSFEELSSIGGDLVEYEVKPNFRELGGRYGKNTPKVAAQVTAADPAELVRALRTEGSVTLEAPAGFTADGSGPSTVELGPDDLIVTERPRSGWAVESAAGETLALDLALTPDLRRAGIAREAVRLLQDARKNSGLEVTDRIDLWWTSKDPEVTEALREHADYVALEVLSTTYAAGEPPAEVTAELPVRQDDELKLTFWLQKST
jgi:isoleucyl-tRNA synthetase